VDLGLDVSEGVWLGADGCPLVPSPVFLMGFMGAGKSTLGPLVARQLSVPFNDLDQEVQIQTGVQIQQLFRRGEEEFREIEFRVLQKILQHQPDQTERILRPGTWTRNKVISLGGGTPCRPGRMDWLNRQGLTVFLNVSVDELVRRLQGQAEHRPKLQNLTPEQLRRRIEKLMHERLSYYSQASLVLAEDQLDAHRVCTEIRAYWACAAVPGPDHRN
jgi:shikimate kinase